MSEPPESKTQLNIIPILAVAVMAMLTSLPLCMLLDSSTRYSPGWMIAVYASAIGVIAATLYAFLSYFIPRSSISAVVIGLFTGTGTYFLFILLFSLAIPYSSVRIDNNLPLYMAYAFVVVGWIPVFGGILITWLVDKLYPGTDKYVWVKAG